MSVAVITDSAAAIPEDLAAAARVVVVPMWVTIGGTAYREGEISLEEIVRRADEGLTTSGPSPGELRDAVEANLGADGAMVLTVARRLSGVYEAARVAAEPFGDRVRLLDTRTAAGAQGLVVMAAAGAAAAGGSLERVEAVAREAAARVRLVASLNDLSWIARGGHVPGIAAWAGRTLRVHPVIELRDGRVRPLRPARSEAGLVDRIVSACLQGRPAGGSLHVAAMHALAEPRTERLLAALRARVEPASTYVGSFGPVMVAHTGPDLVGLAWWWEQG